jgi:hypothetical protein
LYSKLFSRFQRDSYFCHAALRSSWIWLKFVYNRDENP